MSALEPGETRSVYAPDFARLVGEHPGVHVVLTSLIAERLRRANDLLAEALYVPADKRVLRRLCDLAALYGDAGPVTIPLRRRTSPTSPGPPARPSTACCARSRLEALSISAAAGRPYATARRSPAAVVSGRPCGPA